ncbi:hypothetical protein DI09_196p40 [Mitosporidium daphniae]|uniref:Uncharacterized protein n=1 Tax=Mitosporidium daphniae TaxID=1485682 RepID=A0A098VTH7_9MICR|nr:uncharacterized protein DI09_196p40 [Mitosporidium daphniae]KGG52270.1 hypothetical protein DI09_196p40 [Mitosporidium daphniae]|eukprot:XP_013238706.1 uncharacterized protein DI09_196p40 [Mitosporidium daphniae]
MESSDCHAAAASKAPIAKLYSSIFGQDLSCPKMGLSLNPSSYALETSINPELVSKFDSTFNMPPPSSESAKSTISEATDISLKFKDCYGNKSCEHEWNTTRYRNLHPPRLAFHSKYIAHPTTSEDLERQCPYFSNFSHSMDEKQSVTDELDLDLDLEFEFEFLSLECAKSRRFVGDISGIKFPHFHSAYKDWVDIYFASIEPLLSESDYKWMQNSSSLPQKLWIHKECFSGGGLGYSSMAMETLGTTTYDDPICGSEKLRLFCSFYNDGNEGDALAIMFSNPIGRTFADLLDENIGAAPTNALEPPILSLAALLYNHNYNHECFQSISFYISSALPSLVLDGSEHAIQSLIIQIIKAVQHPMDAQVFCNVQKCLSLLLLMIGKPLLALDCLISGRNASQNVDPILTSRICALIRMILLSTDGTNPLFRDLSKSDFASIMAIWNSIRAHIKSDLASEHCKSFALANVNFELLLETEQALKGRCIG